MEARAEVRAVGTRVGEETAAARVVAARAAVVTVAVRAEAARVVVDEHGSHDGSGQAYQERG